jgi:hypothetical protein
MTFIKSWEDFERAAEKLYLSNPMKVTGIKKPSISSPAVYGLEN